MQELCDMLVPDGEPDHMKGSYAKQLFTGSMGKEQVMNAGGPVNKFLRDLSRARNRSIKVIAAHITTKLPCLEGYSTLQSAVTAACAEENQSQVSAKYRTYRARISSIRRYVLIRVMCADTHAMLIRARYELIRTRDMC